MKNRSLFLLLFVLQSKLIFAAPCEGKGTVFFYGNGMFNSKEDAKLSQETLFDEIKKTLSLDSEKEIKTDLAYKTSEPVLFQIFNVVSQKGIDRWEDFWLWLGSMKMAPQWFQETMKLKAADALKNGRVAFDDIQDHFEKYSQYLRKGYNIVLISHSQGNLYANQAMKKLADYSDSSLTGSLLDKRKENPLFPKFSDLFANVQVATPVSATINSSPWNTFHNDLIMAFVRKTVGALPANLRTNGSNTSPNGDPLGHGFIKAYLRNHESRSKILSDIQAQYNRLKYPIAYFQKAFLIEHLDHPHGDDPELDFKLLSSLDRDLTEADEKRPSADEIINQTFVSCFNLPVGISKLELSTYSPEKLKQARYTVWTNGKVKDEKSIAVQFQVKPTFTSQYWDVGTLQVEKGTEKEPLKVKVEIYPQPKPRRIDKKDL